MLIATIQFQTGSAALREPSAALLDDLVATLRQHPRTRIRVEGHAHPGENGVAATGLGQARANAVMTALTARAVNPLRVVAIGCEESSGSVERRRADVLILED